METNKTTTKTLTENQINSFRAEAYEHGDYEMGAICDLALDGSFDRDNYTTLDTAEADRVAKMDRAAAYAAIVSAINDAQAQS